MVGTLDRAEDAAFLAGDEDAGWIKGERAAAGSVVATKRSNVRGAKGPCHLQSLRRKEGKDEMIKASVDCRT